MQLFTYGMPIPMYPELRMGFAWPGGLATIWQRTRPELVHIATEGPLGWAALRAARRLRIPASSDFRTNFQSVNPGGEYTFDHAKPAYRYGYELASDRTRSGEWSSVEPDARRRWEERNPGTWDKFKDAARYAYDRAKSKVQS